MRNTVAHVPLILTLATVILEAIQGMLNVNQQPRSRAASSQWGDSYGDMYYRGHGERRYEPEGPYYYEYDRFAPKGEFGRYDYGFDRYMNLRPQELERPFYGYDQGYGRFVQGS